MRESVVRSADSSKVSCAPRWTPPSPPVAKTVMPAGRREVGGGGDGRRAHSAAGRDRGELADADLGGVLVVGEPVEGGVVETDPGLAVDDRDGRRHGTAVAHRLLELARQPRVVGPRQAVADDRALQRDHRPAVGQRVAHLVVHQHGSSAGGVSCSRAGRTHVVPARVPHPAATPRARITSAYDGGRLLGRPVAAVAVDHRAVAPAGRHHAGVLQLAIGPGHGVRRRRPSVAASARTVGSCVPGASSPGHLRRRSARGSARTAARRRCLAPDRPLGHAPA